MSGVSSPASGLPARQHGLVDEVRIFDALFVEQIHRVRLDEQARAADRPRVVDAEVGRGEQQASNEMNAGVPPHQSEVRIADIGSTGGTRMRLFRRLSLFSLIFLFDITNCQKLQRRPGCKAWREFLVKYL